MSPVRKGDGTELSFSGIQEVRKGDGTVLWGMADGIPESEADEKLFRRWLFDEEGDTFVDLVADYEATNGGTTRVQGGYAGGAARDGDGVDDWINIGSESFGSQLNDYSAAVGFSVEADDSDLSGGDAYWGMAQGSAGDPGPRFFMAEYDDDDFRFVVADDGDSRNIIRVDGVLDGEPHRIILNITGESAGDMEVYVDQSEVSPEIESNDGFDNFSDFNDQMATHARTNNGSPDRHADVVIDDFCLFDEHLTTTEAESYENPWG